MDGVRVRYFPSQMRRLYVSLEMRTSLRRIREFDIVHNHSVFLWPTMAAARAAYRQAVPYVISPRGMLVRDLIERKSGLLKKAWIGTFESRNFQRAAAIHFTSRRELEDAKATGIPVPKSFVVPNGVDIIPVPDVPRDARTVLYLGRINWKKGLDRLIDAMPGDARLIIAGNDEESLIPKLRRRASARNVEFIGPVYGQQKWELLASAAMLALPSLSENFGNVIIEAMMMRTPVMVSPAVGLAGEVAAANAGVVTEDFGVAILHLLNDPQGRESMGINGRALVETNFSWPTIAAQMEHEYQCLIGSRRSS